MARTSRLWVPLLVGLLVAGVLGVGSGGAVVVEPRTVVGKINIPAAAFTPQRLFVGQGLDYLNLGEYLENWGIAYFVAPVQFPVRQVKVRWLSVYADDNLPEEQVCVSLYRTRAAAGHPDTMDQGSVCTVHTDYSTVPQFATTNDLWPRLVDTSINGSYLLLTIHGGARFYGARITYTYETTP